MMVKSTVTVVFSGMYIYIRIYMYIIILYVEYITE